MSKVSLTDVSNITGSETTAINTINSNSQTIETAFDNTISRDGTSPNTMLADLDMNDNDILNVGTIDVNSLVVNGVAFAADSVTAVGPTGATGATGPQGPAGTTSPVATTSATGTVTLGTLAQALAGSPTGAYAPTLDVIKAIIDIVCPVGTVGTFFEVPTYWLELNGGTIGSGASGATSRANDDTINLYTKLWGIFDNAALSIQTSTGVPSTRGISAAADFAANKRLPLPNTVDYFLRHKSASRTVGDAQADAFQAHQHTGTTDSQGNHYHSVGAYVAAGYDGAYHAIWANGDGVNEYAYNTTTTAGAHTHVVTTNATTGGTTATETRPKNISVLYCVRY